MIYTKQITQISLFIMTLFSACSQPEEIDISGQWHYRLDPKDVGTTEQWYTQSFDNSIILPAALRDYKIGNEISLSTDWTGSIYDSSWYFNPDMEKYRKALKFPFWLTPVSQYKGAAWYQREIEIPAHWQSKDITLELERPHWQSKVWIDTLYIGAQNSLSVPHRFLAKAKKIKAGKHTLTVRIDNALHALDPGINSHSISDHTQGNWNGIVGQIELKAVAQSKIKKVKITPIVEERRAIADIQLQQSKHNSITKLEVKVSGVNHQHVLNTQTFTVNPKDSIVSLHIPMGENMKTWSEFSPDYYQMEVKAYSGKKLCHTTVDCFGMRNFTLDSLRFAINGKPVFLRGTTECSVFPLTGYPPTDVAAWDSIYAVCKRYGLNHMRFHSYCPPEAAFSAADKAGIYLQIEGPSWAKYSTSLGYGRPIDQYLMDETKRIIDAYGNHPSFVMMAYGNEPSGRYVGYLENWVDHFRHYDSRILYTGASTGGSWHTIHNSDFIVRAPPRGLAWKDKAPESLFDYRNKTENQDKPYVTFEMGQWCAFPNFDEIKKYTGTLKAKNFELFEEDLKDKGMSHQAHDFLMASGKLQASCYKQEIEATLRTPNLAGFQLLSLNDFPGQGSALVGVLDAFWEEKGYINGKAFSQFCNSVVPLVRLAKYVYKNSDTLAASIQVANFSGSTLNTNITWHLDDEHGTRYGTGQSPTLNIPQGNEKVLASINQSLQDIKEAKQLTLTVNAGTYRNSWNIWVYPEEEKQTHSQAYICHTLDKKAINILNEGGKVILLAGNNIQNAKEVIHYQTPVFWNTSWFRMRPPHTTGLLIKHKHPLFENFPTSYYTDHQWWEIANRCNIMNLSAFPDGFTPLVQVIDTWFVNRKLGLIAEARVGQGRLIFSSLDFSSNMNETPAKKGLYNSLIRYANSSQFTPQATVSIADIASLFEHKENSIASYNTNKP